MTLFCHGLLLHFLYNVHRPRSSPASCKKWLFLRIFPFLNLFFSLLIFSFLAVFIYVKNELLIWLVHDTTMSISMLFHDNSRPQKASILIACLRLFLDFVNPKFFGDSWFVQILSHSPSSFNFNFFGASSCDFHFSRLYFLVLNSEYNILSPYYPQEKDVLFCSRLHVFTVIFLVLECVESPF